MVSTNTLCKKLLNVKTAVIEGADFYADGDGVNHILIHARPNVWHEDDCPFCHKRCRRYDKKNPQPRIWRGLDWGGTLVEMKAFKELYQKIKRHKEHILNTIWLGMSNARIEATNNKIKLIIRKAYGFRNIQNMLDMVYLVCSDLRVPLPNRKPKTAQSA